jgi:ClpP class serine protease
MYHQFKERVARGRGLTLEEVEERAQGRVWSGRQALALGLVDSLGTLEDAVDWLADQVGLRPGKYSLRHYPRQRELLELLLEEGRSELVQLLSFRNPLEEFLPDAALLRKWYGRMELPLVIR